MRTAYWIGGLVLALAGCGGAGRACVPGIQQACACPGGASGAQVCATDGRGFGECMGCGGDMAVRDASAAAEDMTHLDLAEVDATDGSVPVAFFPDIQADIDTAGCGQSGCHSGATTATMLLTDMPTAQADKNANYVAFTTYCDNTADPGMSTLMENAIGADDHVGGAVMHVGDAVYNRWVAWIAAGELKGQ